jgi:hypothetical protein
MDLNKVINVKHYVWPVQCAVADSRIRVIRKYMDAGMSRNAAVELAIADSEFVSKVFLKALGE